MFSECLVPDPFEPTYRFRHHNRRGDPFQLTLNTVQLAGKMGKKLSKRAQNDHEINQMRHKNIID